MSVAVPVELGIPVLNCVDWVELPVLNCVDWVEYDTGVLLMNTEGIRKSFWEYSVINSDWISYLFYLLGWRCSKPHCDW